MIKSKKELQFYMMADLMMNRGVFKRSFLNRISEIIDPDYTIRYLRIYRKMQYYKQSTSIIGKFYLRYYNIKKNRLGAKIGFYIGGDYGYGLVIPHYGCVVAGGTVGNYAVLHSSVCITGFVRTIGDGLYVSTGARLVGDVSLGNNVTISPNAVVSRTRHGNNVLLDGSPAKIIMENYPTWYDRDGLTDRVEKIEKLKKEIGL